MANLKLAANVQYPADAGFIEGFENLEIGLCFLDANGVVLGSNSAFRQTLNLNDDWKGLDGERGYSGGDAEDQIAQWFAEVQEEREFSSDVTLADGNVWSVEGQVLPSGGVALTLQERLAPADVGTTQETKSVSKALRESEERFRALVDHLPAGVTLKDEDQNVIFVNGQIEDRYGIPPEKFLGKKFHHVMSSANDENFVSAQQRVLDGEGSVTTEIVSTFKDGSDHILQTIFFPVRTGETGKVEVGTVAFDITHRKQTEKLLLKAQRKEAIGDLTRHIAHEFNNILSVVIGNLEFIDELSDGNSQLAECVRDASGEARRGAEIIDQLMAFARCQQLDAEDTDLHQWWSELDDLVELSIGEKITVDVQLATDLWHCHVDPTRLKHSVLDLFKNAGNAMPSGGQITFGAENVTLGSDLAASVSLQPGRYIRLTITDTGSGIPKEELAHVFEPFYCGRSAGKGNGLGLSMVWGFAHQSGGCADITSAPDQGTSVYLYLPAADGAMPTAQTGDSNAHQKQPAVTAKILLVEDKESLRQLTRKLLERNGFAVVDVSSAEAALEALYENEFDLLISDIRLPGPLNGDELVDIAVADFPELKVVLMSAQPLAPAVEARIGSEIEAFLPKPFSNKQAISIFKSILE